jgi:hypothetical protein
MRLNRLRDLSIGPMLRWKLTDRFSLRAALNAGLINISWDGDDDTRFRFGYSRSGEDRSPTGPAAPAVPSDSLRRSAGGSRNSGGDQTETNTDAPRFRGDDVPAGHRAVGGAVAPTPAPPDTV